MRTLVPALLALAACSPVRGGWSGQCELQSSLGPAVYDIQSFEIDRIDGALTGPAIIQPDWFDDVATGVVVAERDGDDFTLVATMGDVVSGFVLTLTGPLDNDVIEGPCRTTVEQSDVLEEGTGSIQRVDTP